MRARRQAALLPAVLLTLAVSAAVPPSRSAGAVSAASSPPAGLTGALPASAHLLRALTLPGYGRSAAVLFQAGLPNVGVAVQTGATYRLVWSRSLPAGTATLRTPGHRGLFQISSAPDGIQTTRLFAFRYTGSTVTSAIAGHSSGRLNAGEGIVVSGGGFTASRRDRSHTGSIPYRLVTRFTWSGGAYGASSTIRVPDLNDREYPRNSALVHTRSGDWVLLRLDVADTPDARALGLMYRKTLDPDSGMIFVWPGQARVHDDFWMENTYVPLSIAFLGADGRIQEIQDMAPLTTELHSPAADYVYAVEVNQGFFRQHGIGVGDQLNLNLG